TMSVSATGTCGVSAPQTLNITVHICTGINEIENNGTALNVFPNPNNGLFELKIHGLENENLKIKVYDLIGALVYETEMVNDDQIKKVNLDKISNGVYFLKVNSGHKEYAKKIVVNK